MKMKILIGILLLTIAGLIYTLATMPDPYRYGQCPEGYRLQQVVTSCEPTE